MDHKPSLRNVICSAQEYLTFVENCLPYEAAPGVQTNAAQLRQEIREYNREVQTGMGKGQSQAAFEDRHAKALMLALKTSRQLITAASQTPGLKNYVVDGGGSEWNRQNPLKLSNHLRDLCVAEDKPGTTRAPSAYHHDGPMEYEAHGGHGVLKVRNLDQTLSYPPQLPSRPVAALTMKPRIA
jgi:hypothetical protein